MFEKSSVNHDSVVVLFKGGRLSSWYALSPEKQDAYSVEHITLMKSVANKYKMMKLEGYKLFSPMNDWQRFWVMEFPTFEGAESWIKAEMEPPYGRYGYYNYYLARRTNLNAGDLVVKEIEIADENLNHTNLVEDQASVVVITFNMSLRDSDWTTPKTNDDQNNVNRINLVANQYGLLRFESYQLITPQSNWHTTTITEFPTIDGAQAWINLQEEQSYIRFNTRTNYLSRKWAPKYFNQWIKSN